MQQELPQKEHQCHSAETGAPEMSVAQDTLPAQVQQALNELSSQFVARETVL